MHYALCTMHYALCTIHYKYSNELQQLSLLPPVHFTKHSIIAYIQSNLSRSYSTIAQPKQKQLNITLSISITEKGCFSLSIYWQKYLSSISQLTRLVRPILSQLFQWDKKSSGTHTSLSPRLFCIQDLHQQKTYLDTMLYAQIFISIIFIRPDVAWAVFKTQLSFLK